MDAHWDLCGGREHFKIGQIPKLMPFYGTDCRLRVTLLEIKYRSGVVINFNN